MKKNLLLWGTAVILVLIAIYVTKFNDRGSSSNNSQGSQVVGTAPASTALQTSSGQFEQSVGQKAADFTLTDLEGNKVRLSDLKGKNVYINFWATWCTWCVKEMPEIEKAYRENKDKNLVILAVDIGEGKDTVKNFISRNNYHFNVLLDSDQRVAQAYNISSIPVSIFIDKDGNIADKRIGAMSEEEMKSYINKLIG